MNGVSYTNGVSGKRNYITDGLQGPKNIRYVVIFVQLGFHCTDQKEQLTFVAPTLTSAILLSPKKKPPVGQDHK